MSIFDTRI